MLKFKLLHLLIALFIICFLILAVLLKSAKYIKPNDLFSVNNTVSITIDNINIVSVNESKIHFNKQLIIEHGRIKKIQPAGTHAEKTSIYIDAKGRYATPGLFDMHVHFMERKALALSLAYGVTSVRVMRGFDMHLLWKKELENKQWLGSNLYTSSAVLSNKNTHLLNQAVTSKEHAIKLVQHAKKSGVDLIKVYGDLPLDEFNSVIIEAQKLNMPIAKHGPHPTEHASWQQISNLQSLEHAEDIFQGPLNYQFDLEKLADIVNQISQLNTPIVPTLSGFEHLTRLSNEKQHFIDQLPIEYINPLKKLIEQEYSVKRWLADTQEQSDYHTKKLNFLRTIVNKLAQHQVKLLVGSDSGTMYSTAGLSTHNELTQLKLAGLSNFTILQAATINAAETLNVDKNYGSINKGKIADLVLTTQDPTLDLSRLETPFAVVKHGQWLDQENLNDLKSSSKNHAGIIITFLRLIDDLLIRKTI